MDQKPSPDAVSHYPRPPSTALEFITFTNPEIAKSRLNRRRVKSQAMRMSHKSRDTTKIRRNEIELDITPLLQNPALQRRPPSDPALNMTAQGVAFPTLMTPLGTSLRDPFFRYPFSLRHRELELINHLHDGTCFMFRILRDVGFLNRVRETFAFCQVMAMSSWHTSHLTKDLSMIEHVKYSLIATRWLQNQIKDPVKSVADDVITAVLAFVCCANLLHDFSSLRIHLNGLKLLLNANGGLHRLDCNYVLRMVLFWADINGAYLQDTVPQFPPPTSLLPQYHSMHTRTHPQPFNDTSVAATIDTFCSSLKHIQSIIGAELRHRNLYTDPLFPGLHLSPILGSLLRLRVDTPNQILATAKMEAFRSAAILYVSGLRARFGVDTFSGDLLYASRLRALFSTSPFLPGAEIGLSVWMLSVAASSQSLSHEDRDWFAGILKSVLATGGIADFDILRGCLDQFVWDVVLLESETNLLKSLF